MAQHAVDESTVDVVRNMESTNPTGSLTNPAFLRGMLERAAKTAAQTTMGALGVTALDGVLNLGGASAWDVDWWHLLGVVLLATLASVCFSVANPEYVAGKWEVVTERKVVTQERPVLAPSTAPAPTVVVTTPEGVSGPDVAARVRAMLEREMETRGVHAATPTAETLEAEAAAADEDEDPVAALSADLKAMDAEDRTP